ncbi:exodeoxyribonuclease-like [Oppia nitens]|uniref:exodeoxyribonuclease-like n=1 Tax=Oppia nitens TaxID=1686743 RepID=UPI0023D99C30|nr:exodeoxyribonuclease-like [Oppia nitens]XP_054153332.1 exodeoxyribonuclease-like [Oppia nitens]
MSKRSVKNQKISNKKIKIKDEEIEGISDETNGKTVSEIEVNMKSGGDNRSFDNKKVNMKIMSWNVSGLRAALKKDAFKAIDKEDADIVCLQEIKCEKKDIPEEINVWQKYRFKYYCSAQTKGYSGVSLFSKEKPLDVKYGINIKEHDSEGRVITAEFESFYVITAYIPNSGKGLVRLGYRQKWNTDFEEYIKKLDEKKSVILCGDLNVSHKEIDLENPKTNTKTAGFTKEEREDFTRLLSRGFIDSFRHLYPNLKKSYTFWSYMRNARQKDIGWRLDYFVVSKTFIDNVIDNQIRKQVMGSDHCPIVLLMSI